MLKHKTTLLRWSGPVIKEYTKKGYVFTKKDDYFEVKITDLSPRSNVRIDVICDYCGEEYNTMYCNYTRYKERSPNKKDSCTKCVQKKGKDTIVNFSSPPSIKNLKKTAKVFKEITSKPSKINFYSDNVFELIKDKDELLSAYRTAFKERGYKLIDSYVSKNKNLEFYCSKHKDKGKMTISHDDFRNGKGCVFCRQERNIPKPGSKNTYDSVKKHFEEKDCTLISDSFMNAKVKLLYICNNHNELGIQTTTYSQFKKLKGGCATCFYDMRRGQNSHLWKGGVSPLNIYMRSVLYEWKKESMKACNFRCVITGDKFDVVHHLYNYSDMLEQALEECNLKGKDVSDYTEEELIKVQKRLRELHFQNGLGVCLRRDIHDLFHKLYGKVNNTKEEFEEFAIRFHSGELDSILLELQKNENRKKKEEENKIHFKTKNASLIEINGEKRTVREWADLFGIHISTLRRRIESGWEKSELSLPPNSIRHPKKPQKNTTINKTSSIKNTA